MPEKNEPWSYYPFIKWYPKNWLHGSARFDCTSEERGIFLDLVCMANESRNRGVIQANETTPYPHKYIAQQINVPVKTLDRCLRKFENQERIHENETGIHIINFGYYQGLDTRHGRGRQKDVPQEQLPLEPPVEPWTAEHSPKAAELWEKCLVDLQKEVSKSNYYTWLRKTKGLHMDSQKFVVGAPNNFVGDYLVKNQMSLIERSISEITHKRLEIEIRLYDAGPDGES